MNTKRLYDMLSRRRKTDLHVDQSLIGDVIKRKRKERRGTQELISKGVCSVSYLSKIENNKMIPSEYVIKELSKRLEIDMAHYMAGTSGVKMLEKALGCFYAGHIDGLENIATEVATSKHHILRTVIDVMRHVVAERNQLADKHARSLELSVLNMDTLTCQIYLLLAATLAYRGHRHVEAYQLLAIMRTAFQSLHAEVDVMAFDLKAEVSLVLGYEPEALHAHKEAMRRYENLPKTPRMFLRKLKGLLLRVDNHPADVEKALIPLFDDACVMNCENLYRYLYAKALDNQGRSVEAREALERMHRRQKNVWYYRGMLILARLMASKDESLDSLASIFSDAHAKKVALAEVVAFETLRISDREKRIDYVKSVALPLAYEQLDLKRMNDYTHVLSQHATDQKRYKEAVAATKKTGKKIRAIQEDLKMRT